METLNNIRQEAREAFASGDISYSIELYEKIFRQAHRELTIEDVINYGAILRQSKQLKKASTHYVRYIPEFGINNNLIRNACNCWIELKDFERCRIFLKRALGEDKNNPELLLTLGYTELSAGKIQRACEIFEKILRIEPRHFDAWFNLGVAKAKGSWLEEALNCFRNAHQLNKNNQLLKANIITVLQDLNRIDEAWQELSELTQKMRSSQEIKAVEASLLMAEENYAEASILLEKLTRENPQNAKYWLNWSTCLKAIKYTIAPKRILKTALLWHPEHIDLQHSFAQSMAEMGKVESYKQSHHCWKHEISDLSKEHIFSRQFLEISSNRMNHTYSQELSRHWESQQYNTKTSCLWADHIPRSQNKRRMRIGYLSADWRNHPVGRFMLPILKAHDRKNFEIWCVDSTPKHDWISNQLKQHSDHWMNIQNLNGLQAARQISDQQLDILIELGGFTGGSRLDCLAYRPCPVQLSYLGYPAPTYLKCIDGWIGDKELFSTLSSGEKNAHSLLYIEGGYMAFDPGLGLPEPDRVNGAEFRFGCFNHARKLSDSAIRIFCRVLRECPQSTLHLKSISFHEQDEQHRIRKRFEKEGIEPERLIIMDWVQGGLNHLACYNMIDAALDPFPYGGATTTAEALWMGVPVVTIRHSGMAGCLSTSLLSYGNQKQWIAESTDEYLEIARTLFAEGPRTKENRIQLRSDIKESPVADALRLSRELESHYQTLQHGVAVPSR